MLSKVSENSEVDTSFQQLAENLSVDDVHI